MFIEIFHQFLLLKKIDATLDVLVIPPLSLSFNDFSLLCTRICNLAPHVLSSRENILRFCLEIATAFLALLRF